MINSDYYEYNQRVRFEQKVKIQKAMDSGLTVPTFADGTVNFDELTELTGTPLIDYTDLRMYAVLGTSSPVLTYEWSKGSASKTSSNEHRLEESEYILPLAWKFGVQKTAIDASAPVNHSNFPVMTHADKLYFSMPGTATVASEADAVSKVWGGHFAVKSEGLEYHKDVITEHSRYVPERGYNELGNENYPGYGGDQQKEGYVQFLSDWIFKGSDNVQTILDLGAGEFSQIAGDPATGLVNQSVFMVRGLIVHGWTNGSSNRACLL